MANILLVDDDIGVRKTIGQILEQENHQVKIASNREEAVQLLNEGVYEVAIVDMVMPPSVTAGLDVIREAKARNYLTQIIVLTAYGNISNAVQAMEAGAFTYLEKLGEGTEEFQILLRQIERALEYRDITKYAACKLNEEIRTVAHSLESILAQIKNCVALLNTIVDSRERLLAKVQKDNPNANKE